MLWPMGLDQSLPLLTAVRIKSCRWHEKGVEEEEENNRIDIDGSETEGRGGCGMVHIHGLTAADTPV